MTPETALLQLPFCAAMCGLIWFVQVVHYPLLARVGEEQSVVYQAQHMRRTTYVVLPLMGIEFALAFRAGFQPAFWRSGEALACGFLLAVVWGSTFLVQVPLHARLARAFDAGVHRALVRTNWVRTLAWTVRLVLLVRLARGG